MIREKEQARDPKVIRRLVLQGKVELQSPLLIGGGENDNLTDIMILRGKDGKPIIPGTSLAGVFRSILETDDKLFGNLHTEEENKQFAETQSTLVFSDIILSNAKTVVRDSVKISNETGVAANGAKFDYELVERGATGNFKVVATIRQWQNDKAENIIATIQKIGQYLLQGIGLGAKTRYGFGVIQASHVTLDDYDFNDPKNVKAWLLKKNALIHEDIKANNREIAADTLDIEMQLNIKNSLLIRTGDFENDNYLNFKSKNYKKGDKIADSVQIKSNEDFLIPGASVHGIIRHQAYKIMTALNINLAELNGLFGFSDQNTKKSQRGRVVAREVYFKDGAKEFKQCRNKIDRFTGGTIDSALMTEIPVLHEDKSRFLTMKLQAEKCKDWEVGLLLLIVKDICTGHVAFGGEKSIGRGVMEGIGITIKFRDKTYTITCGDKLQFSGDGNPEELNNLVKVFYEKKGSGSHAN